MTETTEPSRTTAVRCPYCGSVATLMSMQTANGRPAIRQTSSSHDPGCVLARTHPDVVELTGG